MWDLKEGRVVPEVSGMVGVLIICDVFVCMCVMMTYLSFSLSPPSLSFPLFLSHPPSLFSSLPLSFLCFCPSFSLLISLYLHYHSLPPPKGHLAHTSCITCMAGNSDGNLLLTGSEDATAKLTNVGTGKVGHCVTTPIFLLPPPILGLAPILIGLGYL